MMDILVIIFAVFGWAMVALAIAIVIQGLDNFHFVRKRIRQVRPPHNYMPPADLICPCCGLDQNLEENLRPLLAQDYPDYKVIFTVADPDDPAVPLIRKLLEEVGSDRACLVFAGPAKNCAQKVHNQLQAIRQASRGVPILAFIDSDIHPGPNWLRHLVDPLVRPTVGVVTGYRWYVPARQNLASLTLSVLNAVPAGGMGRHCLNHAWGGTMAIRKEHFDRLKIADIWSGAITDDLTLSTAVKKAGLRVVFEPKCYCASRDALTWSELFEFVRRQFIITKVCKPGLWLIALAASLQYALTFWLGLGLAIWTAWTAHPAFNFVWPIPLIIYAAGLLKGILRRINIFLVLPRHKHDLNRATWLDIFASPLTNLVMLFCIVASAPTKTIIWRGTKYRLHSPGRTEVIRP